MADLSSGKSVKCHLLTLMLLWHFTDFPEDKSAQYM